MKRVFVSPDAPGLHTVVSPAQNACRAVTIFRLNLRPGENHVLTTGELEMNALLISGEASSVLGSMAVNDSFYLPGETSLTLSAGPSGASFYIGAAKWDGVGETFFRAYDPTLPLGEVHQIHGEGAGRREVFFTLNEEVPASRLICGFTVGGDGAWTSWPPHQHEKFLEEAYCYYGMTGTSFHLCYPTGGAFENAVFQPVTTGSVALAADGYHPTIASPGTRSRYFWVLAAFDHASRSYRKAVPDPRFG